jgi:CO dehydrogenase/acetyl-CoA synthase beta subunit
MSGINVIERQLNQSYSGYLGIGFSTGYGFTLQQQTQFVPFVGVTITYMPSWLTLKLGKKYK